MLTYPKACLYEILYAKYLDRLPHDLLRLAIPSGAAQPLAGWNVLDLCGGNGRASLAALELGADRCVLVDQCLDMIPHDLDPRIQVENISVAAMGESLSGYRVDVAICQQAINYWFSPDAIAMLADVMSPGSVFVFNTFNTAPTYTPQVKQYEYRGRHYVETSWRVEDTVHHVQVCGGYGPHVTKFSWISPELFRTGLDPFFDVAVTNTNKTAIYRCVRRGNNANH